MQHVHEHYGLNVSIVAGIVVPRDAMSNIVRQTADALQAVPKGANVRIFTQYTEIPDSRMVIVGDAASLAADHFFRSSDIVIFHFGIRYPLFPAIELAPRTSKAIVFFHGVTPPHLVSTDDKSTLEESFRQMSHFHAADQVIIASDSLRRELRPIDLPESKITKVPLCAWVKRPTTALRLLGTTPRLLYVSRFVPAKGTLDLLMGLKAAVAGGADLELDIVGSLKFSDAQYLHKLKQYVHDHKLTNRVRFHFDPNDQELAAIYSTADALVSPSHHEGFGVTIAEALIAQCFVITSDAGAQPETAGGLGLVYPCGSIEQLAAHLKNFAKAHADDEYPTQAGGRVSRSDWRRKAAEYANTLTIESYATRFRAAVLANLQTLPDGVRGYLADSTRPMLKGHATANDPRGLKRVYEKLDAQFQQVRLNRAPTRQSA